MRALRFLMLFCCAATFAGPAAGAAATQQLGEGVGFLSGVFGLERVDFTNMENLLEWRRFFLRREVI